MRDNPGFGVVNGDEDATAVIKPPFHHAAIHEEEENRHPASQRGLGPVARAGEVVFEVETDVAKRFFGERLEMLVIVMIAITGETVGPLLGEVANC